MDRKKTGTGPDPNWLGPEFIETEKDCNRSAVLGPSLICKFKDWQGPVQTGPDRSLPGRFVTTYYTY